MNIAFKINKAVEEQMKEDGTAPATIPLFRTISMYGVMQSTTAWRALCAVSALSRSCPFQILHTFSQVMDMANMAVNDCRWFLFTSNYYAFARGFYMQLHEIVPSEQMKDVIDKALRHHQFISFCLYIAGVVYSVDCKRLTVAPSPANALGAMQRMISARDRRMNHMPIRAS